MNQNHLRAVASSSLARAFRPMNYYNEHDPKAAAWLRALTEGAGARPR